MRHRLEPDRSERGGFTLIELLVIIAILAILASLLLPALGSAKQQAQRSKCLSQLRQFQLAWQMYADDANGQLAPNAHSPLSGTSAVRPSWAGGWMDFDARLDNVELRWLIDPAFQHGTRLGPYLKTPAVFKCPADKSVVTIDGVVWPRVRTTSINCSMNGLEVLGINAYWQSDAFMTFKKLGDLNRAAPALMFVFVDEREDSLNDGYFASDLENQQGLWTIVDFPGSYHNGGANLTFADGHAETRRWQAPRPPLARGELLQWNVASPGSPDVAWLQERISTWNGIGDSAS